MPSGSAMKLGDVLTMRNGKTVEVHNTDAEGRLILADALSRASTQGPDAIVDLATLTGACMVALGDDRAGVMGTHDGFVEQVLAAGEAAGEKAWKLPLPVEWRPKLDSDVADMKNMGGANGGAIHAALFLEDSRRLLREMQAALERGDRGLLRKAAHMAEELEMQGLSLVKMPQSHSHYNEILQEYAAAVSEKRREKFSRCACL